MKLTPKLFLAILLTNMLVVVLIIAGMRWSIREGFVDYVSHMEDLRLVELSQRLAEFYHEHGRWEMPRPPAPPRFGGPEFRQRPGPPPGPGPGIPRAEGPQARYGALGPIFAPSNSAASIINIQQRVSLYDNNKNRILGEPQNPDNIKFQPIELDGELIGWLGLRPLEEFPEGQEQAFLSRQIQMFYILGAVILVLAASAAFLFARHLLQPIKTLLGGYQQLRGGDFSVRLPEQGKDELANLAAEFNLTAKTLAANEKSRRQWIADIAHELRTPLAILQAELESIQDGIYQADEKRIGLLHKDSLQLSKLVDDLHQLAMSDLGALDYQYHAMDLIALISDVLTGFEPRFASQNQQLERQFELDDEIKIQGDANKLTQLLVNLFENAHRYTDQDGVIRIQVQSQGQFVRVQIDDSPPGVPEWAVPRLFDRLFRVDASRSRASGGSGLGMSICKTIVEAHCGNISAKRSDLGGLCVVVELPINQGEG